MNADIKVCDSRCERAACRLAPQGEGTGGYGHNAKGGFSLLELLCSMAILMVIVLMVSTIFAESDRTWTLGTNRADNNATGRAAVNMIANDLEYAVADKMLGFRMRPDPNAINPNYGFANSEICFVSLQNNCASNSTRTALEMAYYVEATNSAPPYGARLELKRAYYDSQIVIAPGQHCYGTNTWFDQTKGGAGRPAVNVVGANVGLLAQNVTGLGFYGPGGASFYDSTDPSSSNTFNRLPPFVDIWLEILNDRPAAQVGHSGMSIRRRR